MFAGAVILLGACTPKSGSFDGSKVDSASGSGSGNQVIEGAVIGTTIDNRGAEQVLCEEGPRVIGNAKKADFSPEFKLICEGNGTSQAFKRAVTNAYTGTGTPQVEVLKVETGENFVTELSLIFALKAPLENPSLFADLKPHDIFAAGIKEGNSELFIKVESRQSFPGRASVEQIVLNYDLKLASGASIHDIRRTEFNTYLLVEGNRDIAVSSEHLLDAETNEYYHKAQGLTIGIKGDAGQSYMVFVTNLVIKNRIEPERMKVTMTNLNIAVAKMLEQHLISKSGK
jgi:hypothetical protein